MNGQFLLWVALLTLFLLFLDLKNIPEVNKRTKGMYFGLLILTGAVYFCIVAGVKLPMPTVFFIKNVSPWVFSLVHT
ncbi:hypothetical protein PAESOLCIP111_06232 [Paenibacillus solanacearum]|uniref:Uncharacterized protein n=1 Tax=Paenibacillus solanacearum TaxID=2048548 RepID=A0A916K923_9BACL|nr:hypothetical protein [Paenibacillus solanacearum]CAG7651040.1 hypothetical protein PAESOLCIP111_06232 [Paenibacillus solanacearum]